MAEEENFVHLGLFPFCIGERSPSAENARFNAIMLQETGATGVGTIYPVGMTLKDAMALYWKSSSASWQLYQEISGSCTRFDENGNIVETGNSFVWRDSIDGTLPLKDVNQLEKPPSFKSRICPDFDHRFTGSITNFRQFCPPEEPPFPPNPVTTSSPFYPVSCFFVPLDLGVPNPDLNVPYRILKMGDLYYPSLLLAFHSYSRLYVTKFFIPPDSNFGADVYKTVNLIINQNSYSISLLRVLNYTADAEYNTQIGDEIIIDTWTP